MRLHRSACLLALAAFVAVPAMAQNNTQYNSQYVPVYNTQTGTPTYYTQTQNGMVPVYNNLSNTKPLPLEQMVAGKNAPSYNYPNQIQPYNFNNGPNVYQQQATGSNQDALIYQQQLLQQQQQMILQQQQQQQQQPQPSYNPQAFGNNQAANGFMNRSPFGNVPDSQIPTKRKVLYKEMNNPLKTPQRLFNPDQ